STFKARCKPLNYTVDPGYKRSGGLSEPLYQQAPIMQISYYLSIVLLFLTMAMVIDGLGRRSRLPYTVVLVLMGLLINVSSALTATESVFVEFVLTHELVLFVFLPALIFESALNLDARALLKDLVP